MKSVRKLATACSIFFGIVNCSGQQTPSMFSLNTPGTQGVLRQLTYSSSTSLTASLGSEADIPEMPKESVPHSALEGASSSEGETTTRARSRLFVFRRYNINVRDKGISGTFDKKFMFVNGLHLATAMLDIAVTQHCIASHTCKEGNPMVPSTPAAAYGVELGLVSLGAVMSHLAKVSGSRTWLITPLVGTSSHVLGIVTGLRHF